MVENPSRWKWCLKKKKGKKRRRKMIWSKLPLLAVSCLSGKERLAIHRPLLGRVRQRICWKYKVKCKSCNPCNASDLYLWLKGVLPVALCSGEMCCKRPSLVFHQDQWMLWLAEGCEPACSGKTGVPRPNQCSLFVLGSGQSRMGWGLIAG